MEKYIANSAAKNMSSLESHTIVPTLTMLGLVSEWIWLLAIAGAAVTPSLLPPIIPPLTAGAVAPLDVGSLRVRARSLNARRGAARPPDGRHLRLRRRLLVAVAGSAGGRGSLRNRGGGPAPAGRPVAGG